MAGTILEIDAASELSSTSHDFQVNCLPGVCANTIMQLKKLLPELKFVDSKQNETTYTEVQLPSGEVFWGKGKCSKDSRSMCAELVMGFLLKQSHPQENNIIQLDENHNEPHQILDGLRCQSNPQSLNTQKNYIGILNEAFQKKKLDGTLVFEEVLRCGPPHQPIFTYSIEVNGKKFHGTAASKQDAKQKSAALALEENLLISSKRKAGDAEGRTQSETTVTQLSNDFEQTSISKHPLCILNELFPGLQGFDIQVKPVAIGTDTFFTASIKLNDVDFTGSPSKTKKEARTSVARTVLTQLFGADFEGDAAEEEDNSVQLHPGNLIHELSWLAHPPHGTHDVITKSVFEMFYTVMTDYPLYSRWKVLAGIVLTSPDVGCKVVSLATGTKCIGGEYISLQGLSVNDSHAEVLARRGFLRFLFSELALIADGGESQFIQPANNRGYELRPGISVHLMISTSPCGDGRIFAPHDHARSKAKGSLRVKVEAGMGTIPVRSFPAIQTWDAVLQGERLLTMSCSDKFCRRNVLGVQGALLSQYLCPIYFETVIIGSMCNLVHLQRALFDRVDVGLRHKKTAIPFPFKLHRPRIVSTSYQSPRQPGTKAPNHAVNWTCSDSTVEIIDAGTGKVLHSKLPSRLCKQTFFGMWTELSQMQTLNFSFGVLSAVQSPGHEATYSEAKSRAYIYGLNKKLVNRAISEGGFGQWVQKPREESNFSLIKEKS